MASITITGSNVGTSLQELLLADEIQPGSGPSYSVCKTILEFHPLGQKMTESPVKMAQSQEREITVPDGPEDRCVKAFQREWLKVGATKHIRNTMKLARTYGIASVAILEEGGDTAKPLDFEAIAKTRIAVNVFDPLNTAGSLVLSQDPNSMSFQKTTEIRVNGKTYHRSRSVVIMNEEPIYIGYTTSAFGYVGRSVYQRALFPLKSFVQTMITDDMVVRKAGVLVAKMKQVGSIVDRVMQSLFAQKRQLLEEAKTDNVLGISTDDAIETLNMQNLEGPYALVRGNILKNIATAADMPAILLENETLTEGFGEGTEDAKTVARYVDDLREQMEPLYSFFDRVVQYRAWNRDFYKTVQNDFPEEYGAVGYEEAFYSWVNSFEAQWPSLLTEPDSEKAKTDKVRLEGLIEAFSAMAEHLDPLNKAKAILWVSDNFNALSQLFPNPLNIEIRELEAYLGSATDEDDQEDEDNFVANDAVTKLPARQRLIGVR